MDNFLVGFGIGALVTFPVAVYRKEIYDAYVAWRAARQRAKS